MSRMTRLAAEVWDFVVGEDWRLAAGVLVALGVTAIVAGAGVTDAWWITPVLIAALLLVTVWRAPPPPEE